MASASPSAQWPSPPRTAHDDRIRRNVACVNCRNSKVRCRQSSNPDEPCQRCSKLDMACVVDRSHKRITKRSKLEKLEQELDAIKQAVRPAPSDEPRPPRSPRASYSSYPEHSRPSISHGSISHPPTFQETPTSLPEHPPSHLGLTASARRPVKDNPSRPRTIGSLAVPGEDIDFYFDKYLECFHPFVPIVRKRDPDECYEACATLFWVIIFITCRRYSRSQHLLATITETLTKDIWLLLSGPVVSLEAIHALLLMCAWPLPTIRFTTDPSTTLAAVAMNVSMVMGLHTSKGSHPEFCMGSRQNATFTDEEASVTWIQACILAQRSASGAGHPPPSIQFNDASPKGLLGSPQWTDLLAMYDVQRYLNRFHLAMASHISSHGSVVESLVADWEDGFEPLKPIIIRHDSDLSRFLLLVAQLEIQFYYFCHPPGTPGPNFHLHTARALTTAKSIITNALSLESSHTKLLTHGPQWVFRSILDASCLLVSALRSAFPPPLDRAKPISPSSPDDNNGSASASVNPASHLVQRCHAALSACSIRDGDLPFRAAALIHGFWSCRDQVLASDPPAMAWPNRLGIGVTCWCFHRFHTALQAVQKNTNSESASKALRVIQLPYKTSNNASTGGQEARAEEMSVDPFQEVDWSMVMDDFGWGGTDSVFMGLP